MAKKNADPVGLLSQDIDTATLRKMPEWFKRLRDAYLKKSAFKQRE